MPRAFASRHRRWKISQCRGPGSIQTARSLERGVSVKASASSIGSGVAKMRGWVATRTNPDRTIPDSPKASSPSRSPETFYPPPDGFNLDALGFGKLEDVDVRATAADNMMRLRRAGVTILAGSDPTRGGIFPGASLHRELGQLVRAGLTPAEAIRAATLDSAAYLANDRPIDFGAVRVGLRADLLLVEGDPTADISRLQAIREVIVDGAPIIQRPVVN